MDSYLERELLQLEAAVAPRRTPRVPEWLRLGFRLTDSLSPEVAGELARRLFFTPQKRAASREERQPLAAAQHFFVDTRHGRVAAWSWAPARPEAPVVCLAHGWSGDAAQMTPLAQACVAAGLRAVALDMPGHGESSGTEASLVHFRDALVAVAGVVGPLRGLVAHSLGCAGATLGLADGGLPAERVVFLAPPAELEPFWDRFRRGTGISPAAWASMQAKSEAWLGLSFAECVPSYHAPRMRTPLLVVHDADDREILQREGRALAAAWPGARFVGTRGLGHVRLLRDARTAATVVDFLAA